MHDGVKRYSETHQSGEQRRHTCASPLPESNEYNGSDDRRDQHKPLLELTSLHKTKAEPRAWGADGQQQRTQQPPEQEATSLVGGPTVAIDQESEERRSDADGDRQGNGR